MVTYRFIALLSLSTFLFFSNCSKKEKYQYQDLPFLTAKEAEELLGRATVVNQTIGNIKHRLVSEPAGLNCPYGGYMNVLWVDMKPDDGDEYNREVDRDYQESYMCFNVPAVVNEHINILKNDVGVLMNQARQVKTTVVPAYGDCSLAQEGVFCCKNGGMRITVWEIGEEEPADSSPKSRLLCNGRAGTNGGGRSFMFETIAPWTMGMTPSYHANASALTPRTNKQTTCRGFLTGPIADLAQCWSELLTTKELLVSPAPSVDCTFGGVRMTTWEETPSFADAELIPVSNYDPSTIAAYLTDRQNNLSVSNYQALVEAIQQELESRVVRYFCHSRTVFSFTHTFTESTGTPADLAVCPLGGRRVYYGYPSYDARATLGPVTPPTTTTLISQEYNDSSLVLDDFYICNPGVTRHISFNYDDFVNTGVDTSVHTGLASGVAQTVYNTFRSNLTTNNTCVNGGHVMMLWSSFNGTAEYTPGNGTPIFIPICHGSKGLSTMSRIETTHIAPNPAICRFGGVQIRSCNARNYSLSPGDPGYDPQEDPRSTSYLPLLSCNPADPDPNKIRNLDTSSVTTENICNGNRVALDFEVITRDSTAATTALFTAAGCSPEQRLLLVYRRFEDQNDNGIFDTGTDTLIGGTPSPRCTGAEVCVCHGVDGRGSSITREGAIPLGDTECPHGGLLLRLHHADSTTEDVKICSPAALHPDPQKRFAVEGEIAKYQEFIESCQGPGLVYKLTYSDSTSTLVPICWGAGVEGVKRVDRNDTTKVPVISVTTRLPADTGYACTSPQVEVVNFQVSYENESSPITRNVNRCIPDQISGEAYSGFEELDPNLFASNPTQYQSVLEHYVGNTNDLSKVVLSKSCPGGGVLMVPRYGTGPTRKYDLDNIIPVCHFVMARVIDSISEYHTIDTNYQTALNDCLYGGRVYRISYKDNLFQPSYFGVCDGGPTSGLMLPLPASPFASATYRTCSSTNHEDMAAIRVSQCSSVPVTNHACVTINFPSGRTGSAAICDTNPTSIANTVEVLDTSHASYPNIKRCPAGGRLFSFRDSTDTVLQTMPVCNYFKPYQRIVTTTPLTTSEAVTRCNNRTSGYRLDICVDYDLDGQCSESGVDDIIRTDYICDGEALKVLSEPVGTATWVSVDPGATPLSGTPVATSTGDILAVDSANQIYENNPCRYGGFRTRPYYDLNRDDEYTGTTDVWMTPNPTYTTTFVGPNIRRWNYTCHGVNAIVERRLATAEECPDGGEVLRFCTDLNADNTCQNTENTRQAVICRRKTGPIVKKFLNLSEGSVAGFKWEVLGQNSDESEVDIEIAFGTDQQSVFIDWTPFSTATPPTGVTVYKRKNQCLVPPSSLPSEFLQQDLNLPFHSVDYCAFSLSGFDRWQEVFVRFVARDNHNKSITEITRIVARVPDGMVYVSDLDWPTDEQHADYDIQIDGYTIETPNGRRNGRQRGPFAFAIDKWPAKINASSIPSVTSYPMNASVNALAVSSRQGLSTGETAGVAAPFWTRKQLCYERSYEPGFREFIEMAPNTYIPFWAQALPERFFHLATGLEWFIASYETPKIPMEPFQVDMEELSLKRGLLPTEFPCWAFSLSDTLPDSSRRDHNNYVYSQFPQCLSRYGAFSMVGNRAEVVDWLIGVHTPPISVSTTRDVDILTFGSWDGTATQSVLASPPGQIPWPNLGFITQSRMGIPMRAEDKIDLFGLKALNPNPIVTGRLAQVMNLLRKHEGGYLRNLYTPSGVQQAIIRGSDFLTPSDLVRIHNNANNERNRRSTVSRYSIESDTLTNFGGGPTNRRANFRCAIWAPER